LGEKGVAMSEPKPDGSFDNPYPAVTNERVLAGSDAMSLERFGELLGWPRDILGRYRKQSELRTFRTLFSGYLGGVAGGEPPYRALSIRAALGGLLKHLSEKRPNAVGFLQWVDDYRALSLIDEYERDLGQT
jgi:hypothetical protein